MSSFMSNSTCSAADFLHPRYKKLCAMLASGPAMHRKMWEWIYIVHHLKLNDAIGPGRRGLVFGVGAESLPALFASLGASITATDAPMELLQTSGWVESGQHSDSIDKLRQPHLVDNATFDRLVTYQSCDMTNIDKSLTGYDFNWSSCCFEHLGSLDAGIEFVINAVERTLKPGGVAVHTTEFNISSNYETLEVGDTVLYRLRDIEKLVDRLRVRGHQVDPIRIAPHVHELDFHVDVPPYKQNPHLKLLIGKFVCTSIGIVIRRGSRGP